MFASNFELVPLQHHLLQYRFQLYFRKLFAIYAAKIALFFVLIGPSLQLFVDRSEQTWCDEEIIR